MNFSEFGQELEQLHIDYLDKLNAFEISNTSEEERNDVFSSAVVLVVWQAFLVGFAEAVGKGIGEEFIRQNFGNGETLVNLTNNAIESIRAVIRSELNRDALRRANGQIIAINTELNRYLSNPDENQPALEFSLNTSALLLGELETLKETGLSAFMIASIQRIAMLEISARKRSSDLAVIRSEAPTYIDKANSLIESSKTIIRNEFDPIPPGIFVRCPPRGGGGCSVSCTFFINTKFGTNVTSIVPFRKDRTGEAEEQARRQALSEASRKKDMQRDELLEKAEREIFNSVREAQKNIQAVLNRIG